jgi:DNA polymerase-3 subunit gamma/tau
VAPDRPDLLEWPQERERLAEFAGRFSEEDLLRSLDVLTRIEDGLRWSPEPRFHLEMALLRLVEMPRLAAFDRLLEQLDQPGAKTAAPNTGGSGSPPAKSPAPASPVPSQAPSESAAESTASGSSGLLKLDPPPIVEKYQQTFGGTIVSARPLPGESPLESEH